MRSHTTPQKDARKRHACVGCHHKITIFLNKTDTPANFYAEGILHLLFFFFS